jgi:hypothetical protein
MDLLTWISALGKLLAAIADRIVTRLSHRKPNLYVHFVPGNLLWCIAQQGPSLELMQVSFWADFNHDDPKETLVITAAYPKGTTPQVDMTKFKISPYEMVKEQISAFVTPVVGKKGKPWTGRIVLLDQFQRKYRTKRATFSWVGTP